MGKVERVIFSQHEATKQPLPDNVANAPELLLGLNLYMEGFEALNSTRGSGYGSEGPIPWLAMRDYCDEFDICGDQRQDFYVLVARMDHAYLEYKAEKARAAAAAR
jgi:hypothetical protein